MNIDEGKFKSVLAAWGLVCDVKFSEKDAEDLLHRLESKSKPYPSTVGELTQELIDHCNKMGHEDEIIRDILQTLNVSHRTLQACFFRVMQNVIAKYADHDHDLRNEAAVEWCREVKKINDDGKHYIPFI